MSRMDTLILNARIATPKGSVPVVGENVEIYYANIGIKDGKICYIGPEYLTDEEYDAGEIRTVDARGYLTTPGFVDAHTHLVFGGYRQNEYAKKIAGVSYLDILKEGGGILSTVESTRWEDEDRLLNKSRNLVREMRAHGTTTIEAKSGYGLDLETELKQLKIVKELQEEGFNLVSTFMGAHAVPKYKTSDEFIEEVISWLPEVKNYAEFVDIFCEEGVFNLAQTEKFLRKAKEYGFGLKVHADEINNLGASSLAGKLGAISAEHLIEATEKDIEEMAKTGTIAVLLPTTSFYLDKPYAKARLMMEKGVPIALGTDFNPGSSPNFNMQLTMNIASLKYKLTPEEVLTAATLNSACAINRGSQVGTIEIGKRADIIIWEAPDLDYFIYAFGSNKMFKTIVGGR